MGFTELGVGLNDSGLALLFVSEDDDGRIGRNVMLKRVDVVHGNHGVDRIVGRDERTKVSAVLVIVLGIVMAARGLSLSGVSVSFAAPNADKIAESGSVAKIEGNVQTVSIDLKPNYYAPIVVQKGVPVRFIIKAKEEDINGCNNAIIIPKYGIEKRLKPGENIIEFLPTEEGNVVYSCWMGMLRSNILVVSDISKVSNEDIDKANEGIRGGGLIPPCCQ